MFDQQGNEIETPLKHDAQPLVAGEFVDMVCLLPTGAARAVSCKVEILDPNTNEV